MHAVPKVPNRDTRFFGAAGFGDGVGPTPCLTRTKVPSVIHPLLADPPPDLRLALSALLGATLGHENAPTATGVPRWPDERGTEMKRMIVDHYGGPDVLKLVEEDDPRPSRGEGAGRVLAAGGSFTDAQLRAGTCAGLMSECRSACGTTGTRPTVHFLGTGTADRINSAA